ncbi:MAG: 16S rRNA (guanine(527)-N(7))-methyltransferase RsmG [Chloroflexota bacterium]
MPEDPAPSLQAQARDLFDISLSDDQAAAMETLTHALVEWNTRINLTAITEPEAIQVRHILDSLSLGLAIDFDAIKPKDGLRVIDVGTGAGFPGLVMAVAYPQLQVTMMDSTAKKLSFVDHMIANLGLANAITLHARAEDAGQDRRHRDQYGLVVARAVARLPALLEYTLPLAPVGGTVIAMKGTTAYEEADDSGIALRTLGGRLEDVIPVQLPGMDYMHHLIVVTKVAPTPTAYPRKPGIPSRKPIA